MKQTINAQKLLFVVFSTRYLFSEKLFRNRIKGARSVFNRKTRGEDQEHFDDPQALQALLRLAMPGNYLEPLLERIESIHQDDAMSPGTKIIAVMTALVSIDRFGSLDAAAASAIYERFLYEADPEVLAFRVKQNDPLILLLASQKEYTYTELFKKALKNTKKRMAYYASGGGSSIEALVTKIMTRKLEGYESCCIICNKPEGKAGVYARAKTLGVPIHYAPTPEAQLKWLKHHKVDLILGLGYTGKVHDIILEAFPNRVLNIHPTLLPKYGGKGMYGLATHMAVLAAGDTHTGVTVHLMNKKYDDGMILRQILFPVPPSLVGKPSTKHAEVLQQFVLKEEYQLMADTLWRIHQGLLQLP